jgi:hypothetical protein
MCIKLKGGNVTATTSERTCWKADFQRSILRLLLWLPIAAYGKCSVKCVSNFRWWLYESSWVKKLHYRRICDYRRLYRYEHFTVLRISYHSVLYQFLRTSITLTATSVNVTLTCHYPYMAAVLNLGSMNLDGEIIKTLLSLTFNSNLAFHSVMTVGNEVIYDFLDSRSVC